MMKRYVVAVIAAVVLIVVAVVYGVQQVSQARAADQRQNVVASLDGERQATQDALDAAQEAVYEQLTGSQVSRIDQDAEHLQQLMATALTWDDHQSYTDAREALLTEYGMDEESEFFTSFFPEAPVNVDAQGNEYPYLDVAELSSELGDFDIELLSVAGTAYRYVVFAEMESQAQVGEAVTRSAVPLVLFATVQENGTVVDVTGYASTGKPRSTS